MYSLLGCNAPTKHRETNKHALFLQRICICTTRCRDQDNDDNACEYTYRYSRNAVTKGTLGMDNLVVGGNVFHGVVFGCSDSSAGGGQSPQASGLVGLGRFMYCLPPPLSRSSGKLVLGVDADAVRNATDRVAVTMSSDERYPSYFYLNLDGVAVGDRTSRGLNRRKATSPAAVAGGDRAHAHGMIVDIASTISFLEESLYEELADDLSFDQTPFRADERARQGVWHEGDARRAGGGPARPGVGGLGARRGGPTTRLGARRLYPGTAFTRRLSDVAAEAVGIIAEPEVKSVEITLAHLFFVVASDGVFEFLSGLDVIDMVLLVLFCFIF
jgi:hypothetical protein